MILRCPGCKQDQEMTLRYWQTGPGVRGAVSAMCEEPEGCGWFGIMHLEKAWVPDFSAMVAADD